MPLMAESISGKNLISSLRTHDVAEAYRLAMAEVRVQLPLGALLQLRRRPRCGGVRAGTGRRLLIVMTQVRFLSPQLDQLWKPSDWMRNLPRKQARVLPVVGSSPTASAW